MKGAGTRAPGAVASRRSSTGCSATGPAPRSRSIWPAPVRAVGVPLPRGAAAAERIDRDPATRTGASGRPSLTPDGRGPSRRPARAFLEDGLGHRTRRAVSRRAQRSRCSANSSDTPKRSCLRSAGGPVTGSGRRGSAAGALQGVRVVELASEHGAFAGKSLADLGAEVIVVEPPGGHLSRRFAPFLDDVPDPERSLWWWYYNTGKHSVTLDLHRTGGVASSRAL